MGAIVVIGEAVRTVGFGLAGAVVFECETAADVQHAWAALPADVLAVILTPAADAALQPYASREVRPPVLVMPS